MRGYAFAAELWRWKADAAWHFLTAPAASGRCDDRPVSRYAAAVTETPTGVLIRLRVTPRAKATALDGLHADALRLRIAAPPVEGKANAAVLGYLAPVLGVRRQDLSLVRGARGRDKTVQVTGLDVAEVLARLAAAAPDGGGG
jgi:uncharacterized protein